LFPRLSRKWKKEEKRGKVKSNGRLGWRSHCTVTYREGKVGAYRRKKKEKRQRKNKEDRVPKGFEKKGRERSPFRQRGRRGGTKKSLPLGKSRQ